MSKTPNPKTQAQFTRDLFAWLNQVIADKALPDAAFKVAYIIGQHINRDGDAWPSTKRIAEHAGLNQSTALRLAHRLQDAGHLTVEPGKPGRGHSHRYRLLIKHAPAHVFEPGKDAIGDLKDAIGGSKTCASAYEPPIELPKNQNAASLRSAGDAGVRRPTTKATRMFEGWEPDQNSWDYANQIMPKGSMVIVEYELDKFVDHWLADAGPRAAKKDWNAAWRRWVRNSEKHRSPAEIANINRIIESKSAVSAFSDALYAVGQGKRVFNGSAAPLRLIATSS